jgi:hypothetical protein
VNGAPISREQIDELLAFRERFSDPDAQFVLEQPELAKLEDATFNTTLPVYSSDVSEFFGLASQRCWTDHEYDPDEMGEVIHDDIQVAAAELDEIRALLTYCVRGERFRDGHWGAMLVTGRIQRILDRLAELREAGAD